MLCNANPRDKKYIYIYIYIKTKNKKKNKKQRTMVTKGKVMKHKDHVKKTQLDRVFCIQNLLDAPRALEFVFTLE